MSNLLGNHSSLDQDKEVKYKRSDLSLKVFKGDTWEAQTGAK